jgi:perosamine synthetase
LKNEANFFVGVGGFETSPLAREYVLQVLDSGRLSYGPFVQKFERNFASHHNSRFAVMSNSGSSSLQVALQALKIIHGWADGDEVLVPATTFVATANIVLHNNMVPVFVDVEPDFFGIDPDKIEQVITSRTRCIIPVHLFGQICQMDRIMDIAGRHQLKVIEDSCETMFSTFKGKAAGSFGDIGCFSTYVAHILTTGVGGIATTSSDELAVMMRSLVNHGRDSIYISIDDDKEVGDEALDMIIRRRFSFVHPGHSYRVTELEGALGLAQLEEWQENLGKRSVNADYLSSNLASLDAELQLPLTRPDADHAFMMFPIVVRNEDKFALCSHLEREGIETRDMLPLVNQPYLQHYFHDAEEKFPVSWNIIQRGFYVGSHPYLNFDMLEHMVRSFKGYFQKSKSIPAQFKLLLFSSSDSKRNQKLVDQLDLTAFKSMVVADQFHNAAAIKTTSEINVMAWDGNLGSLYEKLASEIEEDFLVSFNLNGAHDPSDMPRMLFHLKESNDLVIASRFLPGGDRTSRSVSTALRGVGNRLITLLLNLTFDGNFVDSYQSFRGVSRSLLKTTTFGHATLSNYQLSMQALSSRARYTEFPTIERPMVDQLSFGNALVTAMRCIYLLVRTSVAKRSAGKEE